MKVTPLMLKSGEPMVCPECGGSHFLPSVHNVFLSKINQVNPSGQDLILTSSVGPNGKCMECEYVGTPILKRDYLKQKLH